MVNLYLPLEPFISSCEIFEVPAWAEVAKRSGRPAEATTPQTMDKFQDMVMIDRTEKLREIASAVGISKKWVDNILRQHLGMKKLSAKFVSQLLTVHQKRNRVTYSKDGFKLFQRNPQDFRRCFSLKMKYGYTTTRERPSNSPMGCQRGIWTKEGEDRFSSPERYSDCLLRFAGNNVHRLFGKGWNY